MSRTNQHTPRAVPSDILKQRRPSCPGCGFAPTLKRGELHDCACSASVLLARRDHASGAEIVEALLGASA